MISISLDVEGSGLPLVYISFGTVFNVHRIFLEADVDLHEDFILLARSLSQVLSRVITDQLVGLYTSGPLDFEHQA